MMPNFANSSASRALSSARRPAVWARIVLLAAAAFLLVNVGAGQAAADPLTPSSGSAGDVGQKQLPVGMPAELKQLVAGTDEFKNAPWFKAECATKGGDFAAYLSAMFPAENEMRYWRLSRQEKIDYLKTMAFAVGRSPGGGPSATVDKPDGGSVLVAAVQEDAGATELVDAGWVPPGEWLQKTFPNDRADFYPSTTPVCAEDLKRWGNEAVTTWGFKWADMPDQTSLEAMTGGDATKTKRIEDPCETGEKWGWAYCEHAYFLNCDQATGGTDRSRCLSWNANVGRMFDETANWIDRNTNVGERIGDAIEEQPLYQLGAGAVKAFSDIWQVIGEVVEFINDPDNIIGAWANSLKEWSISLVQHVLPGLAEAGNFDFTAQYFAEWYAKAVGMGIALMVVLFLAATVRAARHGGGQELMFNTAGYMPLAVVLMLFAPGVAYLLEAFFAALSKAILASIGTSIDELVNNVSATLGALTNETLVGGTIMGIVGFGLLGLGAFALYLGLLMHQIGIPLSSCAMAIGFAFFVYPPWRKRALRIPFMVLSLMASVPVLFFMLGLVSAIMNSAAINASLGSGELQSLGQLALMSMCFIVIGISPFAMAKWAPILPDAEDADRMGDSGGGGGQVLGAGMGGAIGASRGARGGGGGEPVGGQGADIANKATSAAANHQHGQANGKSSGGGGGAGIEKGSKALGKAAAVTGPEGGAAGRLLSAAGVGVGKAASFTGHAAYAGASGGTRAAAMNAANRTHSVAADSAPTPDNS